MVHCLHLREMVCVVIGIWAMWTKDPVLSWSLNLGFQTNRVPCGFHMNTVFSVSVWHHTEGTFLAVFVHLVGVWRKCSFTSSTSSSAKKAFLLIFRLVSIQFNIIYKEEISFIKIRILNVYPWLLHILARCWPIDHGTCNGFVLKQIIFLL